MKAMLLLALVFSTNAFAGSYFNIEHKELLRQQQLQAEARAKNPQFYAALDAKSILEDQVDRLESKLARLERTKAFLCHTPVYNDMISVETQFELIQSCKASNKYAEDASKIDSEIAKADQELNYYSGMLELKMQEVAFWKTRFKR